MVSNRSFYGCISFMNFCIDYLTWTDTYFGPGTVDNIKCHIHAIESKARNFYDTCRVLSLSLRYIGLITF